MMWKTFRRWRTSRGFGIHSPFAFDFVQNVLCLRSPYAYYCYDDIISKEERLIFRVANFVAPEKVFQLSQPLDVPDLLSRFHVIVVRNLQQPEMWHYWEELKAKLQRGQTYTNGKLGIIVVNPKLNPEHFELLF